MYQADNNRTLASCPSQPPLLISSQQNWFAGFPSLSFFSVDLTKTPGQTDQQFPPGLNVWSGDDLCHFAFPGHSHFYFALFLC